MNTVERLLLFFCGPIFVAAVLLDVSGCASPVARSVTRIDTAAQRIQTAAGDAQQHTDAISGEENEPHKTAIRKDLKAIVIDAEGIHVESAATLKANEELQAKYEAAEHSWPNTIWRTCKWLFIGGVTLAIVLKCVGTFATGPVGAAASFAASAALAVATGGVSLVETFFSNLFFRVVKPHAEAKKDANAAGANST